MLFQTKKHYFSILGEIIISTADVWLQKIVSLRTNRISFSQFRNNSCIFESVTITAPKRISFTLKLEFPWTFTDKHLIFNYKFWEKWNISNVQKLARDFHLKLCFPYQNSSNDANIDRFYNLVTFLWAFWQTIFYYFVVYGFSTNK